MDSSKKSQQSIAKLIVLGFLILLPFGQLLRLEVHSFGINITVLAVDIIAGLSIFYLPFIRKPKFYQHGKNFFWICIFSLLISAFFFDLIDLLIGSLYLLRIVGYFSFFVLVWNLIKDKKFKAQLLDILITSLGFSALLGWVQYFLFPDLTSLKILGWDDHLGRLVGSYFDPAFTGVIFVLGMFICLYRYIKERKRLFLFVSIFFVLSLAFTYSRASFLSFILGVFLFNLFERKTKIALFFILFFLSIILFLPRKVGEGVRLERTASVESRFRNYKETWDIFKKNSLFGVGFNNICSYKVANFEYLRTSHSCGGSDSSLLLILATTGVVGFFSILTMVSGIYLDMDSIRFGNLGKTSILIIGVSSLFSNVLFYPFIMGVFAILVAIGVKE